MVAVLNQNHRPIAFASRTLNKAERNYTVTERECLVVIWDLNKFKTYFRSLPVKLTLTRRVCTVHDSPKRLVRTVMLRHCMKDPGRVMKVRGRGFPEEQRNSGLASIPQNNIRRTSLSMEALNGDPVDRSE
ncbi:hypothetical protein TNCV_174781 [Trichonephila clavipes]|nr:hypothetical protein TNCV_174781 [Trichonephila clavipes]